MLENLSQAFNYTELYAYEEKTRYFLIAYKKASGLVRVRPYDNPAGAIETLGHMESDIRGGRRLNAVLVEADRIEALKEAYPNYFGDVQVFSSNPKRIVRGRDAIEYTLPPQRTLPPPPNQVADTAWFGSACRAALERPPASIGSWRLPR